MLWAKQSTAATITVGPILDSTGAEYTSAVIGDLTIRKQDGSGAAMASAATLTHVDNGHYTLVTTTGNMDTLGRLQIRCNKSGYQMPPVEIMVLASAVFATLIDNGTLASTTGGRTIITDPSGLADANAVKVGPTGAGTAQTARDLGLSVLLSSGTGTGQLDFTSGVVKANLAQILGTAITETAGLIAAAFSKFFNKATPTGTVNSLPDAVAGASSGLAIVGSNMGTITGGIITTYTGNTPQTGDAYARLGAPAGASVSADIAEIEAETDDIAAIKTQTDKLAFTVTNQVDANVLDWKSATAPAMTGDAFARLGAPAGASVSADILEANADLDELITTVGVAGAGLTGIPGTGDTAGTTTLLTRIPGTVQPQTGDSYARLGAPAGASIAADLAEIEAETDAIGAAGAGLTAIPTVAHVTLVDTVTTLTGNTAQTGDSYARIGANGASLTALATASALAALALYASRTVGRGTVGAATTPSTSQFTPSAFSPSGASANQFVGRIIVFDNDTTTAALRGAATDITASSNAALPLLTFTALPTAPASTDSFSVV